MQVVTGKDYGDYIVRSDEMAWAAMDSYEFRDKGTAELMGQLLSVEYLRPKLLRSARSGSLIQ